MKKQIWLLKHDSRMKIPLEDKAESDFETAFTAVI